MTDETASSRTVHDHYFATSRVHEVMVHISYDANYRFRTDPPGVLYFGNLDGLIMMRDWWRAAVSKEFALEQDHIDVRVRAFGPLDEFLEPLFVRIIAQHTPDMSEQQRITEELEAQFKEEQRLPFRLWVEFAAADFAEVPNP